MTNFFTRWGYLSPFDGTLDDYGVGSFKVTQDQVDDLIAEIQAKNYAPLEEKIEYICDANWQVFRDRLPVQPGTATKSGSVIAMSGWKNVVAYEVYEDDTLVFVSNRASFMLENPATSSTKMYAVAYNGNRHSREIQVEKDIQVYGWIMDREASFKKLRINIFEALAHSWNYLCKTLSLDKTIRDADQIVALDKGLIVEVS